MESNFFSTLGCGWCACESNNVIDQETRHIAGFAVGIVDQKKILNKTKIKKTSKTTTSKNKTSTSSETSSIKQYFSDWTTAEIAMLGVATACSIALLSARFSSNRK